LVGWIALGFRAVGVALQNWERDAAVGRRRPLESHVWAPRAARQAGAADKPADKVDSARGSRAERAPRSESDSASSPATLASPPSRSTSQGQPAPHWHGLLVLPRLSGRRRALPPAAAEAPRGVLGGGRRGRKEHRGGVALGGRGQERRPPRVRRAGGLGRRVRVQPGHCREPGWWVFPSPFLIAVAPRAGCKLWNVVLRNVVLIDLSQILLDCERQIML